MRHWIALLMLGLTLRGHYLYQHSIEARIAPDQAAEAARCASQTTGELLLPGLEHEVEVLRDHWGIPHIYAHTVRDLFMAQGFVAAQDRLWQMEMWRRTGEGRLAEILGPSAIPRDRFARLMRYRGNMEAEWNSYAADAREIIEAFVAGVNANIVYRKQNPPFEFRVMGVQPERWTREVCLTRMSGYVMSRNASSEIARAQLVREIGLENTQKAWPPDPPIPLEIPRGLDLSTIDSKILEDANAAGSSISFRSQEGSNNWTVAGSLTSTGKPILANDPHRAITLPSLRYVAHLVGPGWNVIGAGEPSLPGIAVGHNEHIAFGFTIVGIDQQDLYVEELNPENPLQYRYRGRWLDMKLVREEISVKGRDKPEPLELHFTVHGPVIHEDQARLRAYSLRWVGTEPGTAGYLGSLSLDRATNWNEFLKALERWKTPSENLVYADKKGNIGWQAAGLTPVRKGWSGMLPVPGNGEFEWQGFLGLSELPRLYNPAKGFIATANHNIVPPGYRHSLGYEWTPPYRYLRIEEVLKSRKGFTVEDFQALQHDETSLIARLLLPLLKEANPSSERSREALRLLSSWNQVLDRQSIEAAVFEIWMRKLVPLVCSKQLLPVALKFLGAAGQMEFAIRLLRNPTAAVFGDDPIRGRNKMMLEALESAMLELRDRFGPDTQAWRWGGLHRAVFLHPLAKNEDLKRLLDRGPVPRGGDSYTVNSTASGPDFRQTSGASYRQILDLSDWDRSVAINTPGQSGEPGSPHYDDLLALWGEGKYHPLVFSRESVDKVTIRRLMLKPGNE